MDVSLSPYQLKQLYTHLTGRTLDVILYNEIITSPSLDIFFKHNDSIIIFYPALKINNNILGHYCALSKLDNKYYFYDPLGYRPDEYKKFSDKRLYKEQISSLINHFIKSKKIIDYSNHRHQSRNPKIATCGRHCVIRCIFNGSNDEYNKRIRKLSDVRRGFLDKFIHNLTSV